MGRRLAQLEEVGTRIIHVRVERDARQLRGLERRLDEYGYIVSKNVQYSWSNDKSRKIISAVTYVLAVKDGASRALNIMLTEFEQARSLKLQIVA